MQEHFKDNGWLRKEAPYEVKVSHITEKLREIHGDAFDYSDLEYTTWDQPVKLYCHGHGGAVYKLLSNLYRGTGCAVCFSNSRVESLEQFLEKAALVHGPNKYDYSKVEYTGTDNKVIIYCNGCSDFFDQKPHYHLAGSNCPKCSGRFYKFLYLLQSEDHPHLYKVGISNNPTKRIVALRNELKNNWKQIGLYHLSGKSVLPLEQKIHFFLAGFKYRGNLVPKGDGYTEVFSIKNPKVIAEITSVIKQSGALDG